MMFGMRWKWSLGHGEYSDQNPILGNRANNCYLSDCVYVETQILLTLMKTYLMYIAPFLQ